MTPVAGPDPAWEQIRFKHVQLYDDAQFTYSRTQIFQPGHIAFCRGSIYLTFYSHLSDLGFKLDSREMPTDSNVPKRYCIVNKHIAGQRYEVFLLTTFGGAKNLDQVGLVARYFGMPMGSTQWIDNTPGLTTIPPLLGSVKASFAFAIPTIQMIEPSNFLPTLTRLPPGELERLRQFSELKTKTLPEVQKKLRKDLRNFYRKDGPMSFADDFKPLPVEKLDPISLEDEADDLEDIYHYSSAMLPSTPQRIRLPVRNDIRWPLRYLDQDLNGSKSLIHQPDAPSRLASLPKAHYAPCLPISLRNFRRLIR